MCEDDGDVDEEHGLLTGGAEERDAVEDVKRKPADCEEEKNESQGLGELELLAEVTARVCMTNGHLQRERGEDLQHLL